MQRPHSASRDDLSKDHEMISSYYVSNVACLASRFDVMTESNGTDNWKLSSLRLSLMDRMGVKLDHFGDANSRLARL